MVLGANQGIGSKASYSLYSWIKDCKFNNIINILTPQK